jgi:hypothetical protein
MRFRRSHGHIHHLKKRRRQIGLPHALTRVDEKAPYPLRDHLTNLPADFIGAEAVIPKLERVKAKRDISDHRSTRFAPCEQ